MSDKPSFTGSLDYKLIWYDRAQFSTRTGREDRWPESNEDLGDLRSMPYQKYLRSTHWSIVRARALGYADHRCFYCGATDHLDVHHLTYARRGCELDEDLMVLCRTCHAIEHPLMNDHEETA